MWETQLRDYRQYAEKKLHKVGQKRGSLPNKEGTLQTAPGGDADPQPLYSVPGARVGKDLEKCAQLLAVMMQTAPGLLSKKITDSKTSKMFVSKMRKTKATKPAVVVKTRKACERPVNVVISKKPVPKLGPRGKLKEHAVDSVSETSTELQVRLAGPKPVPLNNSESVVRVLGPQLPTKPHLKVQPGQVVVTKVPCNDQILSSTPISSPSANRHRMYSMHSDNSEATASKLVQLQPVSGPSSHLLSQIPGASSAVTRVPPAPATHANVSLGRAMAPPWDAVGSRDVSLSKAQMVDVMKQYVTQSDEYLTSFIQKCLMQSKIPVADTQHAPNPFSDGHSGSHSHVKESGPQQIGSTSPLTKLPGTSLASFEEEANDKSDAFRAPVAPSTDADVEAILRNHSLELGHAPVSLRLNNSTNKENLPPQATDSVPVVKDKAGENLTDDASTEKNPEVPPKAKKCQKRVKEKGKDRARKNMSEAACGALGMEKPSPADTKSQVRTLLYLFGELRAVTSLRSDLEVQRLLDNMTQTLEQLTPGLSTSGLSTDLELALQPLRSENAQLRRRMRILNQQFKDKCHAVDEAVKPDVNFQVIKLELERTSLETRLGEESEDKERVQAAVATLAQQVQGLMKERQAMVKLLSAKDTDNVRSQQDWVAEAGGLRTQLQTSESLRKAAEAKYEELKQNNRFLEVSLLQKAKEADRLRDLVTSLQGSMSRLLADLKGTKPRPLTAANDISQYIENIGKLLQTAKPLESLLDMQPTREVLTPGPVHAPMMPATFPRDNDVCTAMPSDQAAFAGTLRDAIFAGDALHPEEFDGEINAGLHRAYRLLDRIDEAIMPQSLTRTSSEHVARPAEGKRVAKDSRTVNNRARAKRIDDQKVFPASSTSQEGRLHEMLLQPEKESSHRGSASNAVYPEFDPVNDNYQRQLTQELLFEHDRQNGTDSDVIERMLVRSTHKKNEQAEPKKMTVDQRTKTSSGFAVTSKKALFPLPEVTEDGLSSLEEHQIHLSHEKLPTLPTSESEAGTKSGFSSIHSPFDMDTTEYLKPPENMENQGSVLRDPARHLHGEFASGLTVKELLAPLAKRLSSPARNLVSIETMFAKNTVSTADSKLTSGSMSSDSERGGGEGELDGDDTLTMQAGGEVDPHESTEEDSRYSVTDYFMKYATNPTHRTTTAATATQQLSQNHYKHQTAPSSKEAPQHGPDMGCHVDACISDGTSQSTSLTSVTSVNSPNTRAPQNGEGVRSPQNCLYRGTELDTTLSTIKAAETVSVMSLSTVTSFGSAVSTVDEQVFKDGLAKLDANIARVQSSLQTQIGGYFK